MEAEVILQNIFGKYNVMEMRKTLPKTSNTNILSTTDSIEIVKTYFRYTLIQSVCEESLIDDRIGRIGPKEVKFDLNNRVGLFLSSSNRNSIIAQGNFCTITANTGIYKDKWMYEVQLGSKGIMQIGWGTLNCKYNITTGVGDTPNSYSYDGSRIKKWNVIPSEYGELWLPGDIIGCTLDMNEGIISFYRNGRSLGKAFENISMGPGIAYFPAISLTFGESLTAIFGDIPFRYPIEDYQPIQVPPEIEIAQASFLIHWINQILDYMIHLNGTSVLADNSMTVQTYLNCILEDLIKQLSPLLTIQYIIEVVFIPFLYDITNIRSVGAKISLNSNKGRIKVMTFLDLLWTFLEDEEVKYLLENVISLLYSLFRHISFQPEFYLDALSDLCKAVRTEIHPITPLQVIPNYPQILLQISEFLCRHFMNPLIINVNSKETLLLIFAGFVSHPLTLNTLENVTLDNRLRVIRNLLKPSENKCWAHSSWILMRFWQGHGFAFRYEQIPHLNKKSGLKSIRMRNQHHPKPCPSIVFQLHIRDRLLGKSKNTELFLNCILNQINWAFSEFIGMVQEIYNCSLSTERIFIDSRQLRICSTCFEVAVTSLRVLEMFCFLAPTIFNCETLLCRLFQLLCQILNRMSSKNNTFQEVLSWSIPDLASLDYFPLLTAVIGILLIILKKDMSSYRQNPKMTTVSRVTRLLLIEPSFQMSSLYFVLGEVNSQSLEKKNNCIERFSLLNYLDYENLNEDYIKDEEISKVRGMLNYLDYCYSHLPDLKNLTDDENLCTICYAYLKNTKFIPCGHMTCHLCINRHLLNTKECFFCKAIINKVVNIDDTSKNLFKDSIKQL